jgi:hypothetical protein
MKLILGFVIFIGMTLMALFIGFCAWLLVGVLAAIVVVSFVGSLIGLLAVWSQSARPRIQRVHEPETIGDGAWQPTQARYPHSCANKRGYE